MASANPSTVISLADRVRGAMLGLYIGDALAMPVHWYYDRNQLKQDFGRNGIQNYESPKSSFPGSIMALSNTGGGGRGSDAGTIVGDVILHGKRQFWRRGGNFHYHHGMRPGENTLEASLVRALTRCINDNGGKYDANRWRDEYIAFMTTPGTHNDTYASTCHRMFFANRENGLALEDCPDNDGHNVDTIDGLTALPPVLIIAEVAAKQQDQDKPLTAEMLRDKVSGIVSVTRRSSACVTFGSLFGEMMSQVLHGSSVATAATQAGRRLSLDVPAMVAASRGDPMTACYLQSSFPALLHFAYKYSADVGSQVTGSQAMKTALLASTNAGGENVARGAALGAILGASVGASGIDEALIAGLADGPAIIAEIERFVEVLGLE